MRKLSSLFIGTLSALFGGDRHPSVADDGDRRNSTAVAVPTEDASMAASAREARDSLERFVARLSSQGEGQSDFSVKVPVQSEGVIHWLWLQDVSFDGSSFTGLLGADAEGLRPLGPG